MFCGMGGLERGGTGWDGMVWKREYIFIWGLYMRMGSRLGG